MATSRFIVLGLVLASICVTAVIYSRSDFSDRSELKGIKYDCTNSVDCLLVPTQDQDTDVPSAVPSDFLKNIVSEIASEDHMPKKSNRYLEMAKKLADVGVKEMQKAKSLRSEADLNDEKAQRLEKTLIQLTASYNSKKSIAQWYQEQARSAQKMAKEQQVSLQEQEKQDEQLSRQIEKQAELLNYVDKKHIGPSPAVDKWQSVSVDAPSPALQKAFEQAGRIPSR